jgi:hypothetical protein
MNGSADAAVLRASSGFMPFNSCIQTLPYAVLFFAAVPTTNGRVWNAFRVIYTPFMRVPHIRHV